MAGIAWGLLRAPEKLPQPVMRWSLVPPPGAVGLSLSRDGSQLAFMDFSSGQPTIAMRALDQAETKQLPGADSAYFPNFSPDNQWIAYFNGGGGDFHLKKIPATGGTSITLADHATPFGLSWGEDDTLVFLGAKGGLQRVPSGGGSPETLTTVEAPTQHRWATHLPGGRTLLFNIWSNTSAEIAALDLKTKGVTKIGLQGTMPRYISPGYLIYFRSGSLFAAPFNARKVQVTGPEVPVVENLANISGPDTGDYSIADSGLLVYIRGASIGGKTVLHFADRKGATQPVSDAQTWGTGRLSPDGTRIANSINKSGNLADIWVYDLDRRTPTRLTFGGLNENPIWTRDGRWITYGASNDDKHGIYRVAADGSGKPELITETGADVIASSWSPDGKTLVYSGIGPDKCRHIYTLPWPGGKPTQLHDNPFFENNGEVSPDGRWLAYQSNESGMDEIYVQPFPGPGGKTRISTQGGQRPRWSHDGKELFYLGGASRAVNMVDLQGGAAFRAGIPQELFRMQAGTTWDVAPDGKRFLVEISESNTNGRRLDAVVNWFDELRRRVPLKR
jgi:Tol biopolymer transport system component